jgi:hypothetical protein
VYRQAPRHALYQGDILVVPLLSIDADPPLVTADPVEEAAEPCHKCGHGKLKKPAKPFRSTSASTRFRQQEDLFGKGGKAAVLATLEPVVGLILSHSCDIDQRPYIQVAPVLPLADLNPAYQEKVKAEESCPLGMFYLPQVGDLPDAVAYTNRTFSVPTSQLGVSSKFVSSRRQNAKDNALVPFSEVLSSRLASLSGEGLERLYRANILKDTRIETLEFNLTPSIGVFDEDPDRPCRDGTLPPRGWWWPTPKWISKRQAVPVVAVEG